MSQNDIDFSHTSYKIQNEQNSILSIRKAKNFFLTMIY